MKPEDVLSFWFEGDPSIWRPDAWFRPTPEKDALIKERFAFMLEMARDGQLDPWASTPEGALALVIVLDQFSRQIHRGSHQAFAGDAHARRIAREGIAGGGDARLTPVQRVFLYLPFGHSEDAADQDLAVLLFETLRSHPPLAQAAQSAHEHRDVIRRFGRFPKRNVVLRRTSTPEELAYIAQSDRDY